MSPPFLGTRGAEATSWAFFPVGCPFFGVVGRRGGRSFLLTPPRDHFFGPAFMRTPPPSFPPLTYDPSLLLSGYPPSAARFLPLPISGVLRFPSGPSSASFFLRGPLIPFVRSRPTQEESPPPQAISGPILQQPTGCPQRLLCSSARLLIAGPFFRFALFHIPLGGSFFPCHLPVPFFFLFALSFRPAYFPFRVLSSSSTVQGEPFFFT